MASRPAIATAEKLKRAPTIHSAAKLAWLDRPRSGSSAGAGAELAVAESDGLAAGVGLLRAIASSWVTGTDGLMIASDIEHRVDGWIAVRGYSRRFRCFG
jgi:hypothetical protein